MGAVTEYELEKNSECYYECPQCGDGFPCDKDTFEYYTELGWCDYCEHVWTKDD